MAACKTLLALLRECAKNAKAGLSSDVYLIAYDDLVNVEGSTEKFTETNAGLIDEIGVGATKFVKVGTVLNLGSLTENFTQNENGSYDIAKQLVFSLTNMGSLLGRAFVESLFGQPVAGLVKLATGTWVAVGLNGQFQLKTSEGTIDNASNGRVLTLGGSDSVLVQTVDPTIVAGLLTA